MARVAAQFGDQVNFVGVPGLGDVKDMKKFVDATKISGFPHVTDLDGSL